MVGNVSTCHRGFFLPFTEMSHQSEPSTALKAEYDDIGLITMETTTATTTTTTTTLFHLDEGENATFAGAAAVAAAADVATRPRRVIAHRSSVR